MFQSPHAINVLDCPLSSGGDILLAGTTVLEYGGFYEYFWVDKDFKVLIWSMIDASIFLNSSVNFVIISSESWLLALISFLLASIAACAMMNHSSDLFYILLLNL